VARRSPWHGSTAPSASWYFAGLGNIAGAVVSRDGTRHSMVSHNGTAGHVARQVQEFSYPLPSGAVVVLHSDGLSANHQPAATSPFWNAGPPVIAAALYRDSGRGRDDATVVVVRPGEESGVSLD
jgi:hypothetical protein